MKTFAVIIMILTVFAQSYTIRGLQYELRNAEAEIDITASNVERIKVWYAYQCGINDKGSL